ncbi:MAG: hypothetical protein GY870_08590, partial [archaeon]|nr:hypothetical protein [archaeon]
MAVFNPTMNPLRFYRYNNDPDFQDEWPNYENIRQREQYFDGMYATNFYKDWIVNKEMVLQFRISSGSTTIVITLPDGSTTTIAPTNISPSAWTGVQIYKYSYTPTIEGVYQMAFFDASWISDKFITHSSEKFRRRLIEVQFYNETNDYGMIFESDYSNPGTFANVYTGLNYYTGKLNLPIPKNEKSIYESDRGVLTTLRSTPIKS